MDEASNSYIVDLVGWVRRVNCVAGGLGFNSGRVLTLLSLFLCFFVSLSLLFSFASSCDGKGVGSNTRLFCHHWSPTSQKNCVIAARIEPRTLRFLSTKIHSFCRQKQIIRLKLIDIQHHVSSSIFDFAWWQHLWVYQCIYVNTCMHAPCLNVNYSWCQVCSKLHSKSQAFCRHNLSTKKRGG